MSTGRASLFARLRWNLAAHFVTRPGPEDGQATAGSPERPVMAEVDAAKAAHVGASLTYDEGEIATRGTPFKLASRPPRGGHGDDEKEAL